MFRSPGPIALAFRLPADLPLVLVPAGETLRSPSTLDLAVALGLRTTAQQPLYDVCIAGGGPAGLRDPGGEEPVSPGPAGPAAGAEEAGSVGGPVARRGPG